MSGQQTNAARNFTDAAIEVRLNGGAWTPICGEASSLLVSGGDRDVSEFFTACGDTPIVLVGKRHKIQIKMKVAYTEGLADAWAIYEQAYVNKNMVFQVRWSPHGGNIGDYRFTTDDVYSFVTTQPYPGGEVASADATMFEGTVETAGLSWGPVT